MGSSDRYSSTEYWVEEARRLGLELPQVEAVRGGAWWHTPTCGFAEGEVVLVAAALLEEAKRCSCLDDVLTLGHRWESSDYLEAAMRLHHTYETLEDLRQIPMLHRTLDLMGEVERCRESAEKVPGARRAVEECVKEVRQVLSSEGARAVLQQALITETMRLSRVKNAVMVTQLRQHTSLVRAVAMAWEVASHGEKSLVKGPMEVVGFLAHQSLGSTLRLEDEDPRILETALALWEPGSDSDMGDAEEALDAAQLI